MTKLKYRYTFRVVGRMSFPDDMLRYDRCQPASEADAEAIKRKTHPYPSREAADEAVEVTLIHLDESARWEPTVGRWNSFAYGVVPGVTKERV